MRCFLMRILTSTSPKILNNSCHTDLDDFCHGQLFMCVSISGQNGTVESVGYLNMQAGSKRFFFFSFLKNPFNPDFNFQSLMKP